MATKVDFIDFAHAANSTSAGATVISQVMVGCNGNVFLGHFGSWLGVGSSIYSDAAAEISTVSASQKFYIVDGTAHTSGTLIRVDAITGAHTRIQTGSTGQPPAQAKLINLYHNRLVLTRTESDPYDWFMSASAAYTTFDYSDETENGAVAGNNSVAGKIGDIITAFVPYQDDFALFGCQDSVWLLRGDPKSAGRIDNLIWGGGVVGPQAWARDSEGRLYYLSRTDLMQIPPGGGVPTSISMGRLQRFLSQVDFSIYKVRMAWDAQRKGLWIFFSKAASATVTHLHWDQRLDAFTTHTFPANMGPSAVRSLVGEVYQDRQLLLGGFDGFLWTMAPLWTADNGAAISSALKFTPTALAEMGERGIITETEIVLGTSAGSPQVTTQWFSGDNPQDAVTAANADITLTTTDTGRVLNRARTRGNTVVFRLSNSQLAKTWAYEQGHILTLPAGRVK